MKLYKNKIKNRSYLLYRIINQIFDPIKFVYGLYGYYWFVKDIFIYKSKSRKEKVITSSLFPQLHDKKNLTPFDAHYFFQQLWVFENVLKNKAIIHVDVGSTYQLSGYLSKIVKTIFVDIRPIDVNLPNLEVKKGSILKLPFEDNSVDSLSCLHVVEHIGLGRYGDKIDPSGTEKACKELARVLKPGGILYLSTPIGKDRLCFNAHRVSSVNKILGYFGSLGLESFSYVNDSGKFHENVSLTDYKNGQYECGMFKFSKL
jgi:hypothetical protein